MQGLSAPPPPDDLEDEPLQDEPLRAGIAEVPQAAQAAAVPARADAARLTGEEIYQGKLDALRRRPAMNPNVRWGITSESS